MDKTTIIYNNLGIYEDDGPNDDPENIPYEIECSNCRRSRIIYSNHKWTVAEDFEEEGWNVTPLGRKIACPECFEKIKRY